MEDKCSSPPLAIQAESGNAAFSCACLSLGREMELPSGAAMVVALRVSLLRDSLRTLREGRGRRGRRCRGREPLKEQLKDKSTTASSSCGGLRPLRGSGFALGQPDAFGAGESRSAHRHPLSRSASRKARSARWPTKPPASRPKRKRCRRFLRHRFLFKVLGFVL